MNKKILLPRLRAVAELSASTPEELNTINMLNGITSEKGWMVENAPDGTAGYVVHLLGPSRPSWSAGIVNALTPVPSDKSAPDIRTGNFSPQHRDVIASPTNNFDRVWVSAKSIDPLKLLKQFAADLSYSRS